MATDAQRAWVASFLRVQVAGPETDGNGAHDERLSRLEVARDDIGLNGLQKTLGAQLAEAEKAVQEGSPTADKLLDKLEASLAEAARQKRQQGVIDTIAKASVSASATVVSFAKARLKLQAARSAHAQARDNLRASCEALLKTGTFVTDPRSASPETRARVSGIGDAVPDIDGLASELDDALDRMRDATDPQARKSLRTDSLKAIGDYRRELDDDPLLTRMQDTDGGKFAIKDAITTALDELEDALTD